jgi:hypothetical protein
MKFGGEKIGRDGGRDIQVSFNGYQLILGITPRADTRRDLIYVNYVVNGFPRCGLFSGMDEAPSPLSRKTRVSWWRKIASIIHPLAFGNCW